MYITAIVIVLLLRWKNYTKKFISNVLLVSLRDCTHYSFLAYKIGLVCLGHRKQDMPRMYAFVHTSKYAYAFTCSTYFCSCSFILLGGVNMCYSCVYCQVYLLVRKSNFQSICFSPDLLVHQEITRSCKELRRRVLEHVHD